jgi:4-amino-4-deoxy-L-arabinose transferase-like glycosyltransferase
LIARLDRVVLVLALVSVALAIAYGAYLSPQWDPSRNDQVQYQALARGLVERGEYTRAATSEPFIPEPLRFPGYPLLIAPLCLAGCSMWAITIFQSLLLGALVLMVARFAEPLLGRRGARVSAALVALHPAFAFFAAHALSDLAATVFGFAAVLATTRISGRPMSGVTSGALAAAATLTRPFGVFMFPIAALVAFGRRGLRPIAVALGVAVIVFAVAFAPYVAYTERWFGRPVAGSTGAQLWLGYFQDANASALDPFGREQADAGRAALARFDAITDRVAQSQAFIALDDELRSRALSLIAHDPGGFLARGLARSVELWAGDVPTRPEDAGGLINALWVELNLMLLGFGLAGAVVLARRGGAMAALPLAIIAATWLFSYPLWAEGRFSLPARPFVAIGAAALFEHFYRRRRV